MENSLIIFLGLPRALQQTWNWEPPSVVSNLFDIIGPEYEQVVWGSLPARTESGDYPGNSTGYIRLRTIHFESFLKKYSCTFFFIVKVIAHISILLSLATSLAISCNCSNRAQQCRRHTQFVKFITVPQGLSSVGHSNHHCVTTFCER